MTYTATSKNRSFTFNAFEEYEENAKEGLVYKIESDEDIELFNKCGIDSDNLELWIDSCDNWSDEDKAKLWFLVDDNHYAFEDALDKMNEVYLHKGKAIDAAIEDFDDNYAHLLPEGVKRHVNYESYLNDLETEGSFVSFEYDGSDWVCTNCNSL